MDRFKFRFGLLPRIIVAIALGIGCGYFLPVWAARIFTTFNQIFSQFLGFCIPLIIVGFVAPAISDIGNRAGKLLIATSLLAYGATLCAGMLAYGSGQLFFPDMLQPGAYVENVETAATLTPYFSIDIPPLMSVMTALVTAFVVGLGASRLGNGVIRGFLEEFRQIVDMVIRKAVIPLLPLYIFGIFLGMTISGESAMILNAFFKIIAVIFGLHVLLLVVQYVIASFFARSPISRNPFKLLLSMMPAYFTALGTQSSAATIPVTLERTIRMGVNKDIAGFTVPLCATIHMSGSCLKLVACAMALMLLKGMPYDFGMFMFFISMLGISIVAAPGVPGGAVMASLGLLSSILGFSEADNALMIALYITMDSFGTACNVTGDGALSIIINRFFAPRLQDRER